jgi:F0F1-type ATP synthase beta subunit
VKILEVTGDRVDNKSKLEVIKQEEEIIQREKAELEKVVQQEKILKAKAGVEVVIIFCVLFHSAFSFPMNLAVQLSKIILSWVIC